MNKTAEKELYDEDIKAIKRLTLSAHKEKKYLEIAERRYKQAIDNLSNSINT